MPAAPPWMQVGRPLPPPGRPRNGVCKGISSGVPSVPLLPRDSGSPPPRGLARQARSDSGIEGGNISPSGAIAQIKCSSHMPLDDCFTMATGFFSLFGHKGWLTLGSSPVRSLTQVVFKRALPVTFRTSGHRQTERWSRTSPGAWWLLNGSLVLPSLVAERAALLWFQGSPPPTPQPQRTLHSTQPVVTCPAGSW